MFHGKTTSSHGGPRRARLILMGTLTAIVLAAGSGGPATAADPITGKWVMAEGETVLVGTCGDAYCATVATGTYKGTVIAKVEGPGPVYKGTIIDPRNGKRWTGSMTVEQVGLTIQGCLMGSLCKTVQTWTRP